MAIDKTFFPRLRRLFATGTIIRNIGGKQLKVADVENIQAFGNLQTNSLVDRFTRMYRMGSNQQFNPMLNYQTLRLQLYADYENMDTDGIISSVLDILSEECTLKGESDEMLSIRSSDDKIQKILYDLYYNILNIEFNLPMWIRSMCKYGDFYMHLKITELLGISNCKPLSVYDMVREEGMDPDNPYYTRFRYDPISLSGGTTATGRNSITFEQYEIAHFRLLKDTNYLPYGRAYIEPARKLYKQLCLLEDAMLLHRIMRAPERRVFYINVGNIPPSEVNAFVQNSINQMKKTPFVDPQTGDYNLKFNVQNMLEDYYIPIRPGDNTTKIDTAKGLEYAGIEDVEYIRDKMLAALKVPKAFLNYSDELNGKSTISSLDVRFSRTVEQIQRTIVSELKKIGITHLYTQGFEDGCLNFELSLNNPSIIYEQEKIALLKEKFDLIKNITEGDYQMVSTDWLADKILNMSEDELNEQRDLINEDASRRFRYSQIKEEGNDPAASGVSYGTKHDLASIYKQNSLGNTGEVPDGYDEKENIPGPGRPKEKASIYTTDKSAFGRDPTGKKGTHDKGEKGITFKNTPKSMALENAKDTHKEMLSSIFKPRKIVLYEHLKEDEGLLDERLIQDDVII